VAGYSLSVHNTLSDHSSGPFQFKGVGNVAYSNASGTATPHVDNADVEVGWTGSTDAAIFAGGYTRFGYDLPTPTSAFRDAGDPLVRDVDLSPSDLGAFGGPLGIWGPVNF
jgi:hypothetical protein